MKELGVFPELPVNSHLPLLADFCSGECTLGNPNNIELFWVERDRSWDWVATGGELSPLRLGSPSE